MLDRMRGLNGEAVMVVAVLMAGAVLAALSGCATTGVGAPSLNDVIVKEQVAHAEGVDKFEMRVKTRGDATSETSLVYSGEAVAGVTPWRFDLNGATEVTSPAQLVLAQGYADAIVKAPDTVPGVVAAVLGAAGDPVLAESPGLMQSIVERIIGGFLERFLSGGGE
jgi:hypothetical protein